MVEEMSGVQRVPALLYTLSNNISLPLQELRIPDENGNMVHSQVSTSEVTLTVENILKVPEEDSVD